MQPPDPMDYGHRHLFEPVIKTEITRKELFCPWACDDKGQMYMHVKAFEYMIQNNCLPCNVKFMIEGEEEVGSKSLGWFVERNQEKLANDVILISGYRNDFKPTTIYHHWFKRFKVMLRLRLLVQNRDLHSGLYGGAVENPINVLTKMMLRYMMKTITYDSRFLIK